MYADHCFTPFQSLPAVSVSVSATLTNTIGFPQRPHHSVSWGSVGVDLYSLALHEIGHILGMLHSNRRDSIMWPFEVPKPLDHEYTLHDDDIRGVQMLYGEGTCGPNVVPNLRWPRRYNTQSAEMSLVKIRGQDAKRR